MNNITTTISIVSHQQLHLVKCLLDDLSKHSKDSIKVILTLNLNETLLFNREDYSFPIKIIENKMPKGFGANHNHAFQLCDTPYYCVINPDIRLSTDTFSTLIKDLKYYSASLISPLVLNAEHEVEDSVRKFPTIYSICKRVLKAVEKRDYDLTQVIVNPDWVAGMFMLFKSEKYQMIGGFDEKYFLYYEDVDICMSLKKVNETIIFSPHTFVIHLARRDSHKKMAYFLLHLKSMIRFFLKW